MSSAPAGAGSSMLQVRNLQKTYGRRKVVTDVSLDVRTGEVVGLLGPNGAGKTTSFYMIVGLIRADGGRIAIGNRQVEDLPIHERSRMGLSYLPQEECSLGTVTPIYEEMPGFEEDITQCATYEELPATVRAYIARIEELTGVKVSLVSVGADRRQTIVR